MFQFTKHEAIFNRKTCKCHDKDLMEIRYPYSIRDKKISESIRKCDFLMTSDNGRATPTVNRKYYTKFISEMAITETVLCQFAVWTPKETFMEETILDRNYWKKVSINLN